MSKLALKEDTEGLEYETEEDESSDVIDDQDLTNSSNEEEEKEKKKQSNILWIIFKWILMVISRFWFFPIVTYIVIQWLSNKPEDSNINTFDNMIGFGLGLGICFVIVCY